MLELIRKHQYSIMLLVTVIVIFAFAWWGDFFGQGEQTPGRGQPFVSLGSRTYTRSQISKVAAGSQVAQRHFPFHVFQVERAYRKYDLPGLDYALNTLALRQHAVDYGIAVSPAEIDQRMLSMPDFQTPEARNMAYRMYGSLGLGEGDVAQIVADVITMEKLSDLVSAGLVASDAGAEYDYASRYQTIFSSVAQIENVKPEAVEITEEELKEAYEAQKGGLTTERQVAIRYVFFEAPSENVGGNTGSVSIPGSDLNLEVKPDTATPIKPDDKPVTPDVDKGDGAGKDVPPQGDDLPTDKKPEDGDQKIDCGADEVKDTGGGDQELEVETGGTPQSSKPEAAKPGDAAATPGAAAADVPETVEAKEGAGGTAGGENGGTGEGPKELSIEERAKLKREFNALVSQFWGEFYKDGQFVPGVDFSQIAKDGRYGLNVVETGLFSMSNPPEGIADEMELISAAVSKSLDPPISDPVAATGEKKGYFIFEILKAEDPREKTFEEAKEELEKSLRADKASEASLVAADGAREKIVAAMAAGKSFAEAASEAGLKVEELKPFSPSDPPAEPMNLREMLPAMMEAVPGEVSEPVELFDGKALVFVSKRELWERTDAETLKDGVRSNAVSSQGFNLLGDWFETVRNAWNEKLL